MDLLLKGIIVAATIAAAIVGWDTYTDGLVAKGDAAGYARARGEHEAALNKALEEKRLEKEREVKRIQGVADATRKELDKVQADHERAVAAGQRLRAQLAAAARLGAACRSDAAPGERETADAALDLYADVQRRLDEATDRTIRFADEAHVAGKGCERAYDALGAR